MKVMKKEGGGGGGGGGVRERERERQRERQRQRERNRRGEMAREKMKRMKKGKKEFQRENGKITGGSCHK